MRFKRKNKVFKQHDKRKITKFLWLPLRIGNETRWLEKTDILQEYYYIPKTQIDGSVYYVGHWKNIEFLNF